MSVFQTDMIGTYKQICPCERQIQRVATDNPRGWSINGNPFLFARKVVAGIAVFLIVDSFQYPITMQQIRELFPTVPKWDGVSFWDNLARIRVVTGFLPKIFPSRSILTVLLWDTFNSTHSHAISSLYPSKPSPARVSTVSSSFNPDLAQFML